MGFTELRKTVYVCFIGDSKILMSTFKGMGVEFSN